MERVVSANLAMEVRAQQIEPLINYSLYSWSSEKYILKATMWVSSRLQC